MLLADKRDLQQSCDRRGSLTITSLAGTQLRFAPTCRCADRLLCARRRLKQALLQIEEKELNFFANNCMTVGTQAALLAGFGFTGIIEVSLMKVADTGDALDITVFKILWFSTTVMAMIFAGVGGRISKPCASKNTFIESRDELFRIASKKAAELGNGGVYPYLTR